MKKYLVLLFVLILLIVQIPVVNIFANAADIEAVMTDIRDLSAADKATMLQGLWDYAITVIHDGNPATPTVDAIYTELSTHVPGWNSMVIDGGHAGDGKLEETNVRFIIQKILNNRPIVIDMYDTYQPILTNIVVQHFLVPGVNNPTMGQVFVGLYNFKIEVFTSDALGKLTRYGDIGQKMAMKVGIDQDLIENTPGQINAKFDGLKDKINSSIVNNGLSVNDAIDMLNIFGLYHDPDHTVPTIASTDPANGETGVAYGKVVSIVFSEPILKGTDFGSITIKNAGNTNRAYTPAISNSTLTLTAVGGFLRGNTYTVTIPATAIKDYADNNLAAAKIFSFTILSGGGGGGGVVPPSGPTLSDQISDLITQIESTEKGTLDDQAKVDKIVDLVNDAASLILKASTPEEALTLVTKVIDSIDGLIEQQGSPGANVQALIGALEALADAAMSKVDNYTITPSISGGTATTTVSAADASKMADMMGAIVDTAKKLNDALAKINLDIKVDAVLHINALAANVGESDVQLPASLITAAKDKGIDGIAINTGIATITIPVDDLNASGTDIVALTTKKVDPNNPVYEFNLTVNGNKVTEFSKPVEVSIPYTLKPGEDPNDITVFYKSDDGVLHNVGGVYDAATGTVKFTASHFSQYIIKDNPITFNDLDSVGWAKANIEFLAAKGVIPAAIDGKFNPQANITRAEFASMLVKAFKLTDAGNAKKFTDVKADDWYYNDVALASNAGIIKGMPDGSFAPNSIVTRQDLALMISRALVLLKGKTLPQDPGKFLGRFKDSGTIAQYAKAGDSLVVKFGIIVGIPDGSFIPLSYTTRAQAAVMIYRVYNLK